MYYKVDLPYEIPDISLVSQYDPILRKVCAPVDDVTAHRGLVEAMFQLMYRERGIGLAAPQVGISKRVITVDIGGNPICLINPKIIEKKGTQILEEGCLSLPGQTVEVARANKIRVTSFGKRGEVQELVCSNLLAVCIQHEVDHLDGILMSDYRA